MQPKKPNATFSILSENLFSKGCMFIKCVFSPLSFHRKSFIIDYITLVALYPVFSPFFQPLPISWVQGQCYNLDFLKIVLYFLVLCLSSHYYHNKYLTKLTFMKKRALLAHSFGGSVHGLIAFSLWHHVRRECVPEQPVHLTARNKRDGECDLDLTLESYPTMTKDLPLVLTT